MDVYFAKLATKVKPFIVRFRKKALCYFITLSLSLVSQRKEKAVLESLLPINVELNCIPQLGPAV